MQNTANIYEILNLHQLEATISKGRSLLACKSCNEPVGDMHAARCVMGKPSDVVKLEEACLRRK